MTGHLSFLIAGSSGLVTSGFGIWFLLFLLVLHHRNVWLVRVAKTAADVEEGLLVSAVNLDRSLLPGSPEMDEFCH